MGEYSKPNLQKIKLFKLRPKGEVGIIQRKRMSKSFSSQRNNGEEVRAWLRGEERGRGKKEIETETDRDRNRRVETERN